MEAKQFKRRQEFARKLVQEQGLSAEEIAMILWENACENCIYLHDETDCYRTKDCAVGVRAKAKDDFEGLYDFSNHCEVKHE